MITILHAEVAEVDERIRLLTAGELSSADECVTAQDDWYSRQKNRELDQRRSLAARAALRLVAANRGGMRLADARAAPIRRYCRRCQRDHGQPQMAGVSLSSSSTQASVLAGAAAADQGIGVDVEAIPEKLFPGFDAYALHAREAAELQGSSVRFRMERWVLKEAVLKAAGLGLEHPPHELLIGGAVETGTFHEAPSSLAVTCPLRWRPVLETTAAAVVGLWCCVIPTGSEEVAAVAARDPQDIVALGATPDTHRALGHCD